ncbi:MAG: Electron transport complex, RnfABCDGE type, G subunit, partial [Caldanaerobacter subterraneus]
MKEIAKIGLILLLITAAAGVILGVSNAITSKKIAEI